jgi:hypothetical protein
LWGLKERAEELQIESEQQNTTTEEKTMVINGGMQSVRQELCLQCEKQVAPDARLAFEVRDKQGILMGYLHLQGICKVAWDEACARGEK